MVSAPFDYPSTQPVHTTFVHPEYQFYLEFWNMIRDSVVGEIQIKRKGERYLPKLVDMEPDEYKAYLDRAVFFNMTQRTVTGLMGSLFTRNPIIENLPKNLNTANISKNNQTLGQFVKEAAREIITMGRYGVLLDMDEHGLRPPYLSGYVAENVTDWTIEEINGRFTITEVIVRELRLARPLLNPVSLTPFGQKIPRIDETSAKVFSQDTAVTRAARRWLASYRVLRLEPEDLSDQHSRRIYRQYYHTSDHGDASPEGTPYNVYTPTWRGQPFEFIPFLFLGPNDNTPDVDKPPILDIVMLNHSHYRSYAQLEHGRFYTALPVYWTQVKSGEENASYTVGPSVVWEVEQGCKPGIIEYNGSGLKFLENACNTKEDQIAALGGRLVGVERVSAGESNNMLKMKEGNEAALLLNIANTLDTAFTSLLRWWSYWQDVPQNIADTINFQTNKDFLLNTTGAREFRAIQMMYENGVIPIAVLHDYLRRAEVVPDWMPLDQFTSLLQDAASFPNMADVQARQRGAPDAGTEWESEHVLVDPQVVAVRGYDSQVPDGQSPLPGQTPSGPTTAAENMPGGKGVPPPLPAGNPASGTKPPARGKVRTAKPAATKNAHAQDGSGGTVDDSNSDVDRGGNPLQPGQGEQPTPNNRGKLTQGDPLFASRVVTI